MSRVMAISTKEIAFCDLSKHPAKRLSQGSHVVDFRLFIAMVKLQILSRTATFAAKRITPFFEPRSDRFRVKSQLLALSRVVPVIVSKLGGIALGAGYWIFDSLLLAKPLPFIFGGSKGWVHPALPCPIPIVLASFRRSLISRGHLQTIQIYRHTTKSFSQRSQPCQLSAD